MLMVTPALNCTVVARSTMGLQSRREHGEGCEGPLGKVCVKGWWFGKEDSRPDRGEWLSKQPGGHLEPRPPLQTDRWCSDLEVSTGEGISPPMRNLCFFVGVWDNWANFGNPTVASKGFWPWDWHSGRVATFYALRKILKKIKPSSNREVIVTAIFNYLQHEVVLESWGKKTKIKKKEEK